MSNNLQLRLLEIKERLKQLPVDDIRGMEAIRHELKESLRECVASSGGSDDLQEEVASLLENQDVANLSFDQFKADMIFAISLCRYSLHKKVSSRHSPRNRNNVRTG